MNRAIELHDSTLHGVVARGLDRVIQLRPAYVHESSGAPGSDPGEGYVQDCDIILGNARLVSLPGGLPEEISGGSVTVAGFENPLTLPLSCNGGILFSTTTASGAHIRITADSIATETCGESVHIDTFPGNANV